jgi:predicted enzyme related to lactoylglutathione lyase
VDLWTSDVEGSRAFYKELFGWESGEPDPQFGGYFMFRRDGVDIAGGMGDMGPEMPADNSWKIYLATDDVAKTVEEAVTYGGQVLVPPMAIPEVGIQAVLADPTGARLGAWQPKPFPGYTVVLEDGAPSWSELFTRDFTASADFYRSVFHWEITMVGDTDEFRYGTMGDPMGGENLAGIMDASGFLPEGVPDHWSIYWEVDDIDASVAKVAALGGSVLDGPQDTPYGRMATVTEPTGTQFKLRMDNS